MKLIQGTLFYGGKITADLGVEPYESLPLSLQELADLGDKDTARQEMEEADKRVAEDIEDRAANHR